MSGSEPTDRTEARLRALRETELLDSAPEESYDRITRIAARLLHAPISLVSLVDGDRQFFKSQVGLPEPLATTRQTSLAYSFCQHAVAARRPLAIDDAARHPLVRDNAAVTEMGIRSYAGAPLFARGGEAIGTLCVLGLEPREWTEHEMELLAGLALGIQSEIELRREVARLNEAEAALRESERTLEAQRAELRQMIDVVPHHLFVRDDEGRYVVANRAFAAGHGTTPDGIVGKRDADLGVPTTEAERDHREELDVMRTGTPCFLPGEPRVVGGEQRLYETLKVPFRRAGTDRPAVLGLVRDITDEQRQSRQLRRAERLASVGTLVGGVAHELNNPLTTIKGYASLMLMDPRPGEDREALETIRREAERMARVVADLRQLARETQDLDAPATRVDLNDIVRYVLRIRGYELATHNIRVDEELQPELGRVMGDRGHLEQVVLNLVVNAQQAMAGAAGRGVLTLRTESGADRVSLCVEDDGPGIAPEHQERIFDPFWSTKPPGEGTGLGLSLVHGIVQDLGGEIRVDSGPGRGTRFTVELPCAREQAPAPAAASPPPAPAPLSPLRVLVVDDEAAIRSTLSRYLERRGHAVDEAAEGEGALQRLAGARDEGTRYDAIVCDLRMPGLGGAQFLQRLRDDGHGMDERLIFVTGDAASHEAETFLQQAGVPFVLKPFDFVRVEALIHGVAAGGARSREAARASGERLHARAAEIRRSFLARLRSDPALPAAGHLGDVDLEDHACVLVADLAQMLIIPAASAVDAGAMMDDGAEIRHLTSSLHGAQRARLGWSGLHLAREFEILQEEVIRALVPAHAAPGTALPETTMRAVESFFASALATSRAALDGERTSAADAPR